MAELPGQDAAPGQVQPATPRSLYTPSPLTPTGTKQRVGPKRQSRFTEEVMMEGTPAASVSELSMDYNWHGPSVENVNAPTEHTHHLAETSTATTSRPDTSRHWRTWSRFLNGASHPVPCLVLLAIFGGAMRVLRGSLGSHMGIQAIVAMVFLSLDVLLDITVLFRAQRPWPTWGLILRFTCGIAYISLFLVYVGLGSPFPAGYTYWSLPVSPAAHLVYILLCVEGLWNLLHLPACRYQLLPGTSLLRARTARGETKVGPTFASPSSGGSRPTSFGQNPRFSVAGTEHSSISLTWRRWVRRRSSTQHSRGGGGDDGVDLESSLRRAGTREPSVELTLRERPGEEQGPGGENGDKKAQSSGNRSSSSSSSSSSSHQSKAEESSVTAEEKGREGRLRDIGQ